MGWIFLGSSEGGGSWRYVVSKGKLLVFCFEFELQALFFYRFYCFNMTYKLYPCILFYFPFMYSSYGGGYGTSYGSNYSGYGSSYGGYGSGYGSGYGGYGSSSYGSYGLNRGTPANVGEVNQQDPNRPPEQEINHRKLMFEEYFKMMGGLRSMVEIGFSLVALCNFTSRSWELLKKIIAFLAKASKKMLERLSGAQILTNKMAQVFQKSVMIFPDSKNGNRTVNKVLLCLRVATAIIILIGVALKQKLSKDIDREHDQLMRKYEQVKKQPQSIVDEVMPIQEIAMEEQYSEYDYDRLNLKEGYF